MLSQPRLQKCAIPLLFGYQIELCSGKSGLDLALAGTQFARLYSSIAVLTRSLRCDEWPGAPRGASFLSEVELYERGVSPKT